MSYRAQGALEYLIIIAAVLAISSIVIFFLTGTFGGQKEQATLNDCKQAASNCKVKHMNTMNPNCPECEEACVDSVSGEPIAPDAVQLCKEGEPAEIKLPKKNETEENETTNTAPNAQFSYSPTEPIVGEAVQFTDESNDSDGNITSWLWRFGDGSQSGQDDETYSYNSPGIYTVELTVTDDDNATDTVSRDVNVTEAPNTPPTANFTFSPENPTTEDSVQFTDQSNDPDGSIANYSWSFGDGGTSTQENPIHSYSSPNTYTVELTVTDNEGAKDTKAKTVSVTGVINSCGEINKEGEYDVTQDLSSPSNCLIVKADGVTIHGNNHVIASTATLDGPYIGVGVDNNRDVSIRNLEIVGFDFGVGAQSSDDLTIRGINARDYSIAGIFLNSSTGVVDNNLLNGSGNSGNVGIKLINSSSMDIFDNEAGFNDYGISLGSGSDSNWIRDNVFCSNGEYDLFLGIASDDNTGDNQCDSSQVPPGNTVSCDTVCGGITP